MHATTLSRGPELVADAGIRERMRARKSGGDLIFEIALEDITRAADLFRPIHERTRHIYWDEPRSGV